MKTNPQKAESYAGYSMERNYRSASIHFFSKASKRCIGVVKLTPGRLSRQERWAAIADFLKTNPLIGFAPDYRPTKAEIKKANL